MAARSLSIVVGVVSEDNAVVDMLGSADNEDLGEGLGEEMGVNLVMGTNEPEGLFVAVVGRAGPIT